MPMAMILFASEGDEQKNRALSAPKGMREGVKANWDALAISLAMPRMSLLLFSQSQITANRHLDWVFDSASVSFSSPLAKSFNMSLLSFHGFGF